MTNYFANKQDHAMKEKQSNILHQHSLLSEDISRTDETSWKNEASETNISFNLHSNYAYISTITFVSQFQMTQAPQIGVNTSINLLIDMLI